MKKVMLLPLAALLTTTFAAQADNGNLTQNFNYISGGLSHSELNEDIHTSVNFNDSTDSMTGLYLRGSWNFTGNVFVETRGEALVKDDLTVSQGLLGLGYYFPINNDLTVYGLAGLSTITVDYDVNYFGHSVNVSNDDSGFTGEVGARYQVMNNWTVEPAVRFANYDESMTELRLGNNFKVSEHMSLEANLAHRDFNVLKETNFQLGARYSF
ncbi:outer membrane beta-barrel protein [Photobacterium sp. GSS17]|uniref:outer membrane beta-barrel protein n=1 Tax=Photobacterium sp. GSS17 TaxID=3020715 RepID=UPI0023621FEF|nr:outer membrane beta-barrel protein [Photobacterium sp. GSS17]